MADTYDEAGSQIDQQKAAQLAAMAQYGSQGQSAFIQAQNDVRSQREMAINSAIAEAANRGAPPEMIERLRSQIGQPYDRRMSDMTSAAGMAGYDQSRRLADIESYFGQVKASIPALRTIHQGKLAELNAKAAKDAQNDSLEERRLRLSEARLGLDEKEFFAGLNDDGTKKVKTANLNGLAGEVVDQLRAKDSYVKAKERVDQFVREGLGKDDIKKRINSFVSLSSQPALRQLLIGELDTYAPTKSTPPKAMYDVRTAAKRAGVNYDLLSKGKRFKSVYKDALDTYADGIKHKWNLRDIDDGLRSGFVDKYGNDFPELRKMIRAMYGGR